MNSSLKAGISLALGVTTLLGAFISAEAPASAQNWAARHPRRAEVRHRDNNLNRRINANRGNLDGHYGQLKAEDRGIQRQAHAEARANGGHLTRGEQKQLNHEENRVNNQIRRDRN